MTYPHMNAAFINNIAEEGTKKEAIEWLQETWNEVCYLRSIIKGLEETAKEINHE